ncbi:MAG: hypothetical protein KF814_08220 [Nitrospiraceae bacterium]|nr:hypothetical protein [Nitrospiraceae bacterium]
MSSLPKPRFFADHGYLFLAVPGFLVLMLAMFLFESSANLTTLDFKRVINSLIKAEPPLAAEGASDPGQVKKAPPRPSPQTIMLTEIKARYIWLSTVLLNIIVPLCVSVLCALIIIRAHPARRLRIVLVTGVALCGSGMLLLAIQDETHVLYRAVFGFTYLTLQGSGMIDPGLLLFAKAVVSFINVLAAITPVVAVLAACSIVAPPLRQDMVDPDYLAGQMRQLNEVLYSGSSLLVVGILHMGAWLRWPAALIPDKGPQEAVLGAGLSITMFWGATFTLMLVVTYLPGAIYLARRADTLLRTPAFASKIVDRQKWLKDNGLRLTLEEHLIQFGVMLAPLMAGPLGSFLLAPLSSAG